jgi:hypothetical protein
MAIQIYFNSTGTSPLELASLNQQFYKQFVAEYGSSSSNAFLWPGEQLHSLIVSLINYRSTHTTLLTISKVDANIIYYKNLYKALTKTFFIN